MEVAVPILDMIKIGQSQSSRILTREGQKCARSHSGNVDRHTVRRDDTWREIQGGRLMSWSRRVEGLCSRRAAYRGFQGSKVPRLVFARAPFSGASVSGQPLPNVMHLLSTTNYTTRHTPIRTTLATRAPSIAAERAPHRAKIRRDDCIACWED